MFSQDNTVTLYPSDMLDNDNKLKNLKNDKLYQIQFNTEDELKLLLHYYKIDLSEATKS